MNKNLKRRLAQITEKQEAVLNYIEDCILKNQMPPTRAEIAKHFGYKSRNAADEIVKRLAALRRIELVPNNSRGIKLVPL
jgi:repressor LexA